MIALADFNRTLEPPAGFELQNVTAAGAFLRLMYSVEARGGRVEINIYLNDQGREVLRTAQSYGQGPKIVNQEKANVNENQNPNR